MTHHRVVIVSVEVPKPQPTSAGERLIKELYDALEGMGKNPIVLAPKPAHGQESAYLVQHHCVDIAPRTRYLQKARSRFGTWTPNLEFLQSIKADSYAMKLLQEAETIDLQWSSNLLLAPFIRHLNPAATLVGTFHDISPQRFMRRARLEHNRLKAAVWGAHARLSACLEYAAVGALDHIVVLSDKDGSLLELRSSDADKVEVIRPPAYLRSQPIARSPQPAQLLFVGTMYRWENHEAVQWFIAEILPKIWLKHPEVTLKVVGESPSADIVALGSDERITFTGFVDDVEPLYSEATLVVAPIRLGSGVKFKTLDAILRAIPIVSTNAGVEGIAQVNWVSVLANNAQSFADGVCAVIEKPDFYQKKARTACMEATQTYAQEEYQKRVLALYGAVK